MNRTSPSCRSVRRAARSPARTSTGPEVMRRPTPISAATMPASDVFPSPGGPANSRWSTGWFRLRAASITICRCSVSWPLADELRQGPRPQSGVLGLLGRRRHRIDRTDVVRSIPTGPGIVGGVRGQHFASGLGGHRLRASSRRAERTSSSTDPSSSSRLEHPSDLVGSVAQLGQGGPDLTPGGADAPVGRSGVPERREVEPGLELEQQAGGGLLPDPGHQAQGVHVVLEDRGGQGGRGQGREDGQGQRRARPRGRRAVPRSTVARRRGRIRRARWRPRGRGCARGRTPRSPGRPSPASREVVTDDPVADPSDVDDDLAGGGAIEQRAAQGADHRRPPDPAPVVPAAAATARRSGWVVRWQAARARASATSGGRGGSGRPSTEATIRWTCSLVAEP